MIIGSEELERAKTRALWRAHKARQFISNPEKFRDRDRRRQAARIPSITARNKVWRFENPEKVRVVGAAGSARISERNRIVIKAAKDNPCLDCGHRYPSYVLDFDHVRGDKLRAVSKMKYCSTEALLEEIAKCDLVCANCHRERTFSRKVTK